MRFFVMLEAQREDINQRALTACNAHPLSTIPNTVPHMMHLSRLASAQRTFAARRLECGSAD